MLNGHELTELKALHMRRLAMIFNEQYLLAGGVPGETFDIELERFKMAVSGGMREITPMNTGPAREALRTEITFQCRRPVNKTITIEMTTSLQGPEACSVQASSAPHKPVFVPTSCGHTKVVPTPAFV